MDKRDDSIYVRIPNDLKKKVQRHARKNLRSINQTILYLISRGLHVEDFSLEDWTEAEADDNET